MSWGKFFSIVELTEAEQTALKGRIGAALSDKDAQWLVGLIAGVSGLLAMIESARMSISKLRRMIFGAKTEKSRDQKGRTFGRRAPDPSSNPQRAGHGGTSFMDEIRNPRTPG